MYLYIYLFIYCICFIIINLILIKRVDLKKLHLSYCMNDVFEEQKKLKHKSDGLIFTSESSPYISGNCNKMYKII